MTTAEIIEVIKLLPKAEQAKVAEFARQAVEGRRLSPEELGALAEQMVETSVPIVADWLQAEIVRGFYGGKSDA